MPSQQISDLPNLAVQIDLKPNTKLSEACKNMIELEAGLAILSVFQQQQKAPDDIPGKPSTIQQFGDAPAFDFTKETGIRLLDVLWALSIIFSPSRTGKYVVASVLRRQPLGQDSAKSLFTLYLTTNEGSWPPDIGNYSKMWQEAVNCTLKETVLDYSSDLWQQLTCFCGDRTTGYRDLAKSNVLGKRRNPKGGLNTSQEKRRENDQNESQASFESHETFNDFDCWRPTGSLVTIYEDLKNLLLEIKNELESGTNDKSSHIRTIEKCWQFTHKNGDRLPKLQEALVERNDFQYPERARLFLKTIENLGKLARAFHFFDKFRKALILQHARFEIKFIDSPKMANREVTLSDDDYYKEVHKRINELTRSNSLKAVTTARAHETIRKLERSSSKPHCEIQMLQYVDTLMDSEKSGTWKAIGCSKSPCFSCARLIEHSDFICDKSHDKVYFQSFKSVEGWLSNSNMRFAVRALKNNVLRRIKKPWEKMYYNPDSPTFQDSRSSTLEGPVCLESSIRFKRRDTLEGPQSLTKRNTLQRRNTF
ncbi:hypothetical protein HD806DRAFT_531020 [Xylariaceae sp. AK1471]|nr:hypothetical protein HD806DRAFT_531020 [Xylariaceae sp. AK1471]